MRTLICWLFLFTSFAWAQDDRLDEIQVRPSTATTTPQPTVTVISGEELRARAQHNVADALRDSAHLNVTSSGGAGQPTSLFIRGSKSEHVLVLIDGVEVNDPTNTTRYFDFSALSTEGVERIEIYRGARAVRFGADAIAGVIHIITKKGAGPLRQTYSVEGGSFSTRWGALRAAGSRKNLSYAFTVGDSSTKGFSAANGGRHDEADATHRRTVSSRLVFALPLQTELDVTYRGLDLIADLDAFGGPNGDDPNYDSRSRQGIFGSTLRRRFLESRLDSSVGFSYATVQRGYDNWPDAKVTDDYHEDFKSKATRFSTQHKFALSSDDSLELVFQRREESASAAGEYNSVASRLPGETQSIAGGGMIYSLRDGRVTLEVGARHDEIRPTDTAVDSGSLAMGYELTPRWTTLSTSYGTGFKAPSLFQIHSTLYGNRELKAETSRSWDFSVEQRISDRARATFTYFTNTYDNLIDFNMTTSKYANIGDASTRGGELEVTYLPTDTLTLKISADYLRAKNEKTGSDLLRRPSEAYSADLGWQFNDLTTRIVYRWVGRRADIDAVSFAPVTLPEYDVVNLHMSGPITKNWRAHGKIENFFNAQYAEVSGYRIAGQAIYLGVSGDL